MNRAAYAIIAIVVIVIVVVGGFFLYQSLQTGTNTGGGSTSMDIYGAEYGFGNSASSISSPGPTMTFTEGQTVTVTFHNVGVGPHNWAITTEKVDGSTNLAFNGAVIGTAGNPIPAGGSQSVTFTVGTSGNYYYICQVDEHVSLGMWGSVVVNP